jgi:asparagine synthase (glutamine-hydrolysing)
VSAIAAVVSRGPGATDRVEAMLRAAPHRGGCTAVATLGEVTLGVVDRTAGLARLGEADGLLVAFAGRLDETPPDASRDDDPATQLAAAWAAGGPDVVAKLRGAFTLVVTDGRRLWAVKDHFGTRPLHHHVGAHGWFVATEVKQVLAGADLAREPDLDHLWRTLFTRPTTATAYRGVQTLPGGTVVEGDVGGPRRKHRYWRPEELVETDPRGLDGAAEELWSHLERATLRMLTGRDVLQLSGGLDSTAIAGCTATAVPPVQALTCVYPEQPNVDESAWVELVADHLGMPLTTYEQSAFGLDELERWVTLIDGPVPAVSIAEIVESYRRSAALGADTVLDGQVAEFLLSINSYALDHLLAHGRWGAATRLVRQHRRQGDPLRPALRAVRRTVTPVPVHRYRNRRRLARHGMWSASAPPWMDVRYLFEDSEQALPVHASSGARHRWRKLQAVPFTGHTAGFDVDDVLAAACGVQVRRPFADVDLWTFVLGLRAEVKFCGGRSKPLLREAMRGRLPDAVVDRTDKTVFDDAIVAGADYRRLRALLLDPPVRFDGVDYGVLETRLDQGDLSAKELQWAHDLAKVHAFLRTW